jgi:hypothetical protein
LGGVGGGVGGVEGGAGGAGVREVTRQGEDVCAGRASASGVLELGLQALGLQALDLQPHRRTSPAHLRGSSRMAGRDARAALRSDASDCTPPSSLRGVFGRQRTWAGRGPYRHQNNGITGKPQAHPMRLQRRLNCFLLLFIFFK